MSLLQSFWKDESGSILSAEMVLLGSVGVVGATVGLKSLSHSINSELQELSYAFRSLDQSYCLSGYKSAYACTAGSAYKQQDVRVSLAELKAYEERCIVEQEKLIDEKTVRHEAEKKQKQKNNNKKKRKIKKKKAND